MQLEIQSCVLLILVSIVCWCAIHRLKQIGKPGFKTWPLIGATVDLLVNHHQLYDWLVWNLKEKKRSTMVLPCLHVTYIVTTDPAILENVLKTNFDNHPKGEDFHEKLEPLLGNGIFNTDGHLWRVQRKTVSFEFASKVLRELSTKVFRDHALVLANMVEQARLEQRSLEIQDLFLRMTLDTICKLGFGVEIGVLSPDLPVNNFATAFDQCNDIRSYRFVDPVWKAKRFLRIGQEGALPGFIKTVDDFTYNIIRQRRQQLENLQQEQEMKEDILTRFMFLDQNFSDKDLRDIVLNFLFAGRDTSAGSLTYFIWMIASHPDSAEKISQELAEFEQRHSSHEESINDQALDFEKRLEKFARILTFNSLPELTYLHAAINESLRLFPPVPLNPKGIASPTVLPDGTRVKPGQYVSYFSYGMGRSEALWGADAAEFRPERWRRNGAWDFNVSSFKFPAFQAGPRICLGKESAYLQMKLTAAILCRFFKYELAPDQVFKHRIMATLSLVNGVRVIPQAS